MYFEKFRQMIQGFWFWFACFFRESERERESRPSPWYRPNSCIFYTSLLAFDYNQVVHILYLPCFFSLCPLINMYSDYIKISSSLGNIISLSQINQLKAFLEVFPSLFPVLHSLEFRWILFHNSTGSCAV